MDGLHARLAQCHTYDTAGKALAKAAHRILRLGRECSALLQSIQQHLKFTEVTIQKLIEVLLIVFTDEGRSDTGVVVLPPHRPLQLLLAPPRRSLCSQRAQVIGDLTYS